MRVHIIQHQDYNNVLKVCESRSVAYDWIEHSLWERGEVKVSSAHVTTEKEMEARSNV